MCKRLLNLVFGMMSVGIWGDVAVVARKEAGHLGKEREGGDKMRIRIICHQPL